VSNRTGETDTALLQPARSAPALALLALLLLAPASPANAQSVRYEVWPEIDIYVKLGDRFRFVWIGSFNQDQDEKNREGAFNYFLEFALRPVFRRELRDQEDVFRRRFLTFRAGYQYSTSLAAGDSRSENRAIAESTAKYPLGAGFVILDRNREEFRFLKGKPFSMRYRNRLTGELDLRLRRLVYTAYAYGEIYYDTQYSAWNQYRYAFGLQFPAGAHVVVEPYILRQHDTRSEPRLVNALGLTLNLYF